MVIFGNRLFGKVDQVPGVGYVATKFFHIDYVPLIPYEGWLVFRAEGNKWRGIKIPLSPKSLLLAWGRTAAVIVGVGCTIAALVMISGGRASAPEITEVIVLAIAGWGFFAFSKMHKSITRASYKRACELGRLAKLNDAGMAAIAKAYGEAPPTCGFQPLPPKSLSTTVPSPVLSVSSDQIPLESIPMEEIPADEISDVEFEPVEIAAPEPAIPPRPRAETRRHG